MRGDEGGVEGRKEGRKEGGKVEDKMGKAEMDEERTLKYNVKERHNKIS